jgi:hypothetical protein
MQLCAVSIVGAFFGLTAPFVAVVAAFFAVQLITFPSYVWGSAAEYIGFDQKMIVPQIGIMGAVFGMLVYSLFGELEAMPTEDLSLNAKIMIGFNAFYVLANLPGIFAPAFLGSQYFPGAFPKEKYAAAQMALMMRGLVAILSTSELFPVACAFLPFNFFYMLLFVSFIKGAGETGVDVNAMLFWLPFQGIALGITIMIALDEM